MMTMDCQRSVPTDHPILAYVPDTKSLIEILNDEPSLIECCELSFLRYFIAKESDCFKTDHDEGEGGVCHLNNEGPKDEEKHEKDEGEEDLREDDIFSECEKGESTENDEVDINDDTAGYWDNDNSNHSYTHPPHSSNSHQFKNDDIETYECIIIGAGASGIGVGISLCNGGMRRSNFLILESNCVGHSFDSWCPFTRFISPSLYSNPFGPVDLNAVDPFSSPAASAAGDPQHCSSQHLSGKEYADYLRKVASKWSLPIREHTSVMAIDRVEGTEDWPAGGYKIQLNCGDDLKYIYSRYAIYCGGEWNHPSTPALNHTFEEGAFAHYSRVGNTENDWIRFIECSGGREFGKVVIVGGFEAGIDAACALIELGVKDVTVVDSQDEIRGWPGKEQNIQEGQAKVESEDISLTINSDPSLSLSSMTRKRLMAALSTGGLKLIPSWKCVGAAVLDKDKYVAEFQTCNGTREKLIATVPILMCTGFDPGRGILGECVNWSGDKSKASEGISHSGPIVSDECDESLKYPGFFVCGPMLRHTITNKPNTGKMECHPFSHQLKIRSNNVNHHETDHEIPNSDDAKDKQEEIIFCFIYKFRCRFALVAGEILSRLIVDDHCESTVGMDNQTGDTIDAVGHERISRLEEMLKLYKEKGMLITDLSCAACLPGGEDC